MDVFGEKCLLWECVFRAENVLCTFVSCRKHPSEGHKILCPKTIRNKLKIYISWKGNKLECFPNSQISFQVHDMVQDIWKKYLEVHVSSWYTRTTPPKISNNHKKIVQQNFLFLALKLFSRRLVVFNETNTYRRQNFKTFLKENYAIALENCFKVY